MRKIPLIFIGYFFSIVASFSQTTTIDSSNYYKRKLKLEEVDFVSSYYNQDGNNSAVTGGIGSEKLTDISNVIELKLIKKDPKNRLRLLNLQAGVDAYTSASSDKIDPATISSASKSDRRIYPSATYSIRNDSTRQTIGFIGYLSTEYDYTSISPGVTYTKVSADKNRDFTVKLQTFFDNWKIILPIELRSVPGAFTQGSRRNSFNGSLIFSSVINKRTNFAAIFDPSFQEGLLSTPYQRVYFNNDALKIEKLPTTRFKLPLGFRLNYFLGSRIVIRSSYRFYYDTWNLYANTLNIEVPIKITPFLSVGPVYRFYNQSGVDYFAPYKAHNPSDEFYTSDYDLSNFTSHLIGLNFRKVSSKGILGIKKWNELNLRYCYYTRTTGLNAHSIGLAIKFR